MSPQQAVLKGLSWRHAARMYFGASRASTTRTVLGTNARWQSAFQSYSSAAKHVFSRAANGFASKEELQFTKEPQIAEEVVPDREADAPLTSQINPTLSDDTRYTFDPIFLRDCCSCERCVDPSTTQKTFETADIPLNIRAASVDVQHDGSTQIRWEPDLPGFEDHVSIYDASFRDRNRNLKSRLEATYNLQGQRIPWDCKLMKQSKMSVEYGNYMDSSAALLSSLQHLYRYGLLFIHSVPANPDSVASIANRIGPIKQTFYGPTWDVKSVPSAKNVAYTSSHLGFHVVRPKHIVSTNGPTKQPEQDLPYVDNPAGLQILHCLEASSRGGESLFSDALRAVKKIEQSRPDHYFTLENFPVTYKYHNNNEWYQQTRPHIETTNSPHEASDYAADAGPEALQLKPSIKAINWSPPFQSPFLVNVGNTAPLPPAADDGELPTLKGPQAMQLADNDFRQYLDAARHLKREIEADEAVFEMKLEPGTTVIFDNRRIVHARKAFENWREERWLRGAYVDTDAFRSRLRVLRAEVMENRRHE